MPSIPKISDLFGADWVKKDCLANIKLRDNGDTDTADALESGKGDKDTVKRALNSIYGVESAKSGAKEVRKDV